MPDPTPASRRGLPALHKRAQIEAVGRFATRYPESAWLDMLALRATSEQLDAEALVAAAALPPSGADVRGLVDFAFVLAACADDSATLEAVAQLFGAAMDRDPELRLDQRTAGVWMQALHLSGTLKDTATVPGPADVSAETLWGVETDRANPYRTLSKGPELSDEARWLEMLSTPFTDRGRRALSLQDGEGSPFDRLATPGLPRLDGPLVSVIVPVYNPDAGLLTAVRSLLDQTWANIEVLICDDASVTGLEHLDACAAMNDDRIQILRCSTNQGTYAAFNHGLAHARGRFVTFQGADDYSHPQRLEAHMDAHASAHSPLASISLAVRTSAQLELTSIGLRLIPTNASSFMFERESVLNRLGAYDMVRKAADAEFTNRFVAAFGADRLVRMDEPLAVIQATPNSVSRGELGFLRRHPARQSYRAASEAWHQRVRSGADPFVTPGERAPFPAPAHFLGGSAPSPDPTDIAVLTSLTCDAPSRSSAMVSALLDGGTTTTVMEFVSTQDVLVPSTRLADRKLADLLSQGRLRWAAPGEPVSADLALVDDPEALLTMPLSSLRQLDVSALVVVFEEHHAHLIPTAEERLRASTASRTAWLPASTTAAALLRSAGTTLEVLDPRRWWIGAQPAPGPGPDSSKTPTVGMMSARFTTLSPAEARPDNCIPRETGTPLWSWGPGPARLAGRPVRRVRPASCSWQEFIRTVDYFIAPSTAHVSTYVLDAWSAGTTVLADDPMRSVLRDRALYPGDAGADHLIADGASTLREHTVAGASAWAQSHVSATALGETYRAIRAQLGL